MPHTFHPFAWAEATIPLKFTLLSSPVPVTNRHETTCPALLNSDGNAVIDSLSENASVTRIFTTLAIIAALLTTLAFALGMSIGDATQRDAQNVVGYHLLAGLGALIFTSLVHAIVLTYFMGTGRWLEETTIAYKLPWDFYSTSKKLKYRTILLMLVCFLLLITTGAFGAAADPASAVNFRGFWGFTGGQVHMTIALVTWAANLAVNLYQFSTLSRNGEIIESVMSEVRRIRVENGLSI